MVTVATQDPMAALRDRDIILASGSPRRRELLGLLGVEFRVRPIEDFDERYPSDMPAMEVAHYLARAKCDACRERLSANELLITADTVVVNRGEVLGKPADADAAYAMLASLSGHAHSVVTGVAVAVPDRIISARAVTEVEFSELTDSDIRYYVEHYRPFDKAGAYGIQEWIGAVGVKRIEGSYYNVMGLPLHLLTTMLREITDR